MTDATAELVVAELAAHGPSSVIDVGCGWGELLLRLAACCPEAVAVGIDNDEVLLKRARSNAMDRSLQNRVTFQTDLTNAEASDLVICIGAEHAFGSLRDALSELAFARPSRRPAVLRDPVLGPASIF